MPGRIEVLGKHTDYAGGQTMVATAERGLCIIATPRDDRQIVVVDALSGETVVFHAERGLEASHGLVVELPDDCGPARWPETSPGAIRGVDLALAGDLPPAAGMSSSSALMVGVFLVLAEVNQLDAANEYWHDIGDEPHLAGIWARSRTASGRAGGRSRRRRHSTAVKIAPPSSRRHAEPASANMPLPRGIRETLPVPPGHCSPSVQRRGRRKTGASPGKVRPSLHDHVGTIETLSSRTGRDVPHLAAAYSAAGPMPKRNSLGCDCEPSVRRVDRAGPSRPTRTFLNESGKIVPAAGDALAGGWSLRPARRSLATRRRSFGDQGAETVFLAAAARRLRTAAAPRSGRFWRKRLGLGRNGRADDFLAAWSGPSTTPVSRGTSRCPLFFITGAGPAAFRVC